MHARAPVSPHWGGSVAEMASAPAAFRPCHHRRLAVAIAACAALASGGVQAQTGTACKLATLDTATVRTVVDGRTLVLADGREVRLAALEVAGPGDPVGARAKAALEALVADRAIELRGAGAAVETDRYG